MTGDTDNPTQTAPRPPATRSRSTTSVSGSADAVNRPRQGGAATGGGSSRTLPGGHADPLASRSRRRTLPDAPDTPFILPPRKVFPIQIGSELFRLSGASISSDAPSYFSQFFEEQLRMGGEADSVRTLYIDRDPETFRDIALHLQGYHIEPRDGTHFVRLFADVQFYSFFPGLNQRTLLRPPSILPPSVPGRSANIFADLLHVLKGYPLEIRNAEHRAELLRDARYFHLKGLEQKLIAHDISYNLARGRQEILLRLEDIRQSGISFTPDATPASSSDASSAPSPATANPAELLSATSATGVGPTVGGWIAYQRPFVDSSAYELVLEIGSESTSLDLVFNTSHTLAQGRASFHGQTKARISSLFQVIANKMNLPVTQPLGLMMLERAQGIPAAAQPPSPRNSGISEDRVRVRIGKDAEVVLDGVRWPKQQSEESEGDGEGNGRKRKRTGGNTTQEEEEEEWTVVTGQWRVRMQPVAGVGGKSGMEAVMYAVKLEAVSGERGRNARRGFWASSQCAWKMGDG
ncbi:hypothetical protein H2203_002621 [Taxawa tesnikishii (nom. ined.)]|nr:hypothetical protein H2203_002621 [Dothideales sp. JES 119]